MEVDSLSPEDIEYFKTLNRKKITSDYKLKKDVYNGECTVIKTPNGNKYWLKMFSVDIDQTKIELEYRLKSKDKTYTILELVEVLLKKWHGIAAKAAERMRKEKKKRAQQQPDTDIHSVMEKAMRGRKRGTQGDDDDEDWDSE